MVNEAIEIRFFVILGAMTIVVFTVFDSNNGLVCRNTSDDSPAASALSNLHYFSFVRFQAERNTVS